MVFVTGGRYQGKAAFVREMAEKGEAGFERAADFCAADFCAADFCAADSSAVDSSAAGSCADGQTDGIEAAYHAAVILHLEYYIKRVMEQGEDPELFVQRLIRENGGAVVAADEIGCGIVPVDAFEREYRETSGRLCQKLAASADSVYRVVCGIGLRLK